MLEAVLPLWPVKTTRASVEDTITGAGRFAADCAEELSFTAQGRSETEGVSVYVYVCVCER
jgi:hypothetical protein